MTTKELQQELLEAYRINNLNRISYTLIDLYKNKQYTILQKIADVISDFTEIKITPKGKGFSKFMMLYHPDRAGYHIDNINRLTIQNNYDELLGYSHILRLERLEEISLAFNSYEDIDYSPVYEWDMEELESEGFSIVNDVELNKQKKSKIRSDFTEYNFYDAIKIREFGHTDAEYPPYYLEDIEEFELSSSGINDLDGIQYCIHAKVIDISNNSITDLSPLSGLSNLEELNLSDNKVGLIDGLGNLISLRSILLTNNCIEDISPLLELDHLEYVDLSGNTISINQIKELTDLGIVVNYEY
jgi:Leucine-rich repeat (LRR) protein